MREGGREGDVMHKGCGFETNFATTAKYGNVQHPTM